MIGEGAQDEFLALQGDLQGDLQQEEIRWWMCPSEHNGMLADTRGRVSTRVRCELSMRVRAVAVAGADVAHGRSLRSFASSPAPDGTGLCVQQMSWADSN
eukprot:3860338-Rhodomonas_salina.1